MHNPVIENPQRVGSEYSIKPPEWRQKRAFAGEPAKLLQYRHLVLVRQPLVH